MYMTRSLQHALIVPRLRIVAKVTKMEYRIDYETYNNIDFKHVIFCETKQEAEKMIFNLKKLNHVTAITITATKETTLNQQSKP